MPHFADCFERLKESYKHRSSAARQYRDAFTITDCETYCRRASYCVSFSFRDLTDRDNCILSDIRVTTSADDFNLEYNRDWDVYRPIFGGRCDEHIGGGVVGGGGSIDRTGGEHNPQHGGSDQNTWKRRARPDMTSLFHSFLCFQNVFSSTRAVIASIV